MQDGSDYWLESHRRRTLQYEVLLVQKINDGTLSCASPAVLGLHVASVIYMRITDACTRGQTSWDHTIFICNVKPVLTQLFFCYLLRITRKLLKNKTSLKESLLFRGFISINCFAVV